MGNKRFLNEDQGSKICFYFQYEKVDIWKFKDTWNYSWLTVDVTASGIVIKIVPISTLAACEYGNVLQPAEIICHKASIKS